MEPEDYLAVLRDGDVLRFLQLIDFLMDKWQLPESVSNDQLTPVVIYTFLNCGLIENDIIHFAVLDQLLLDNELKSSIKPIYRFKGISLLSGFISAMTEIKMQTADSFHVEMESLEGIMRLFEKQLLTQQQVEQRNKLQSSIMESLSSPEFENGYLALKKDLLLFFNIRTLFTEYKDSLQITDEYSKQQLIDSQAIINELMDATRLTEDIVLKIYAMLEQWKLQSSFGQKEREFCKKMESFLVQTLSPDVAKTIFKQSIVDDWMELNLFNIGRNVINFFSTPSSEQDKREQLQGKIVATL